MPDLAWLDQLGENARLPVPDLREALYIIPSTICNFRCRFCASRKSTIPKQVMSNDLFFAVVEKACAYGFEIFGLSPMVGEALTDPAFLEKLQFLEGHPRVAGYSFCTNLSLAGGAFLDSLKKLKKLRWLAVSVCGHTPSLFTAITGADEKLFRVVVRNLKCLTQWPRIGERFEVRLRTSASYRPEDADPELGTVLKDLAGRGVRVRVPHDRYSNWAGLITQDELSDAGITLKPARSKGNVPCTFLFYKHTVLPDGRLDACSTADAHAEMVIGDLTRQDFSEIYSLSNARWLDFIRRQCEGRFSRSCEACTDYRALTDDHYTYDFHQRARRSLRGFFDQLR